MINFLASQRFPIILAAFVFIAFFFYFDRWHEEFRGGDPWGYYAHLPALFIHHDTGDYSKTTEASNSQWKGSGNGTLPTPIGGQSNKYPLGVAILIAPFFLLGHAWAGFSGSYPAHGFSAPYAFFTGLGVILYVLWGLWLLHGVLRRYFSAAVAHWLIVVAALGTNLFYFTGYNNLMSHALLFSLYCLMLYATHRFYDRPVPATAALTGLSVGLIAMTRLHEGIAVVIPLLWGVFSLQTLRACVAFFVQNPRLLFTAGLVAALCLVPQALYYKYVSGSFWWYAYQGESFNFRHPRIMDGLFNYKNGWFIYTPVMLLAVIGLARLRRVVPQALAPVAVFMPLHIWITYSWWCWNYINGFGSRPMVETYPLLLFPLGAFWTWGSDFLWKRIVNGSLAMFFIGLNLFQTWQLSHGMLWTENSNAANYWALFGKVKDTRETLITYDSGETQPGPGEASFAWILLQDNMNDSVNTEFSRVHFHSGPFGRFLGGEYAGTVGTDGQVHAVRPGDWLRASVWGYVRRPDHSHARESLSQLIVEMRNGKGEIAKYRGIKISTQIGNPDWNIWSIGDAEMWGESSFFVKVPKGFQPDWCIRAYVWNPGKHRFFVDDLKVEVWRR